MKRVDPQTLSGPRAYFTDFDRRIVERTSDPGLLRRKVERKLKILLLLKGCIVCAASHLATRFAYHFFKDNPALLTDGVILPALRSDMDEISELFTRKRFSGRDDAIRFYSDHV